MRLAILLPWYVGIATTAVAQDRPPSIIAPYSVLQYPVALQASGIGGVVTAWVVVPPGDSVVPDTVRVVSAPHRAFHRAVELGLGRWRYRGAVRGGRRVADSLLVEVTFTPPQGLGSEFDSTVVQAVAPGADGVRRFNVVGVPITGPWESVPDSTWRAMGVRGMGVVLDQLQAQAQGEVPIACVRLERFRKPIPVTASELQGLQRPGVAVVVPERCPPVFASMARIEGREIPPGEDPIVVYASEVKVAAGRLYKVRVEARGGASGRVFECIFDTADPSRPVRCPLRQNWVS